MYGLLTSQVFSGEGKLVAKLELASAQSRMTQPAPTIGSRTYLTKPSTRLLFIGILGSQLFIE
jgi:hypothetical protein